MSIFFSRIFVIFASWCARSVYGKLVCIGYVPNYIMFNCDMARLIWCICRDALNWNTTPRSFEVFVLFCKSDTNPTTVIITLSLLAAV